MPAKKTKKVPVLRKGDAFYVETNAGKMSAQEMADELGVPLESVTAHVAKLAPKKKKTFFEERPGMAIMTKAQSAHDDEHAPKEEKSELYQRLSKSIHVLRPGEPVL